MDGQRQVAPLLLQPGSGVQRDRDPLEGVQVAEIGEGVARRSRGQRSMRRRADRRAPVLHDGDQVRIDAPADVAVAQEGAGRQEMVHQPEHRLDVLLAQNELVGGPVGEAAVAGVGRGRAAKGVAYRRHHLPVVGADRVIVVQRVDDLRPRADAADQEQHLHAQQQRVVDVHDVRLEGAQQVRQVRHDAVQVDLALEEVVEMPGPQHHLVGAAAQRLKVGTGLAVAVDAVGAGEEQRLGPLGLQAAEQLVREDLGAAGVQAGVVVGDDQDAGQAHRALSFSRTRRSWKFSALRCPLQ